MRHAPPLQVYVGHHGIWRAAVMLLAASASAAMLAWWRLQPIPAPSWAGSATFVAAIVAFGCAATLWRAPTLALRWDGQCWWLARASAAEQAGMLAVTIDLGGWMLLRFDAESRPADPRWIRRVVWVALQRRGLEGQWHAVRCTVYGARSAFQPSGL
jgi:hypothetical protein